MIFRDICLDLLLFCIDLLKRFLDGAPKPQATQGNSMHTSGGSMDQLPEIEPKDLNYDSDSASLDSSDPDSSTSAYVEPDMSPRPRAAHAGLADRRKAASRLQKRLVNAHIEQRQGTFRFYVPEDRKLEIITRPLIEEHIRFVSNPQRAAWLAGIVYDHARNLFTILAYINKVHEICAFVDEEVSDSDLPFNYDTITDVFTRRGGGEIQAMRRWRITKRIDLAQKQWSILAPVFSGQEHYQFQQNTILPFVYEEPVSNGAYSEVFEARIHPAHHKWHHHPPGLPVSDTSNNSSMLHHHHHHHHHHPPTHIARQPLSVAIKRLHYHDEDDFQKERTILVALEAKRNNHLVKLLFSYEYNGNYHLVFLRAAGNLRDYWEQNPTPSFTPETVLWSLRQMLGIAQGLQTIHNFKVTIPLSMTETEAQTPRGKAMMSVSQGEERFGRHGDLKPENILWFPASAATLATELSSSSDGQQLGGGVCQITDFGLGRFHGRDTRTKAAPYTIFSSPTYEPPECHIFMPVSRAYDLWSLGCLFLEWVSWMLKGWPAIDDFSEARIEESFILNNEGKIRDDYFWSLLIDGAGSSSSSSSNRPRDAKVRAGVEQWVRLLREDPQCSLLVHDLLSLIMCELLCITPGKRARAGVLHSRLIEMLARAELNPSYACEPCPWVPKYVHASDLATLCRDRRSSAAHAFVVTVADQGSPGLLTPLHCRTWPTATAPLGSLHSEMIHTASCPAAGDRQA